MSASQVLALIVCTNKKIIIHNLDYCLIKTLAENLKIRQAKKDHIKSYKIDRKKYGQKIIFMNAEKFEQKCKEFEQKYGKNRKLITTDEGKKKIKSARKNKDSVIKEEHDKRLRATNHDDWNDLMSIYGLGTVTYRNLRDFIHGEESLEANLYIALCDVIELDWKDVAYFAYKSKFIGRENELNDIYNFVSNNKKVILIWGESGVGKTQLSHHYFKLHEYTNILKIDIAKETKAVTQVDKEIYQWIKNKFKETPDIDFNKNLAKLRELLTRNKNIGIIIDNLETTLDANGKFTEKCHSYVKLLETLAHPDIKSTTIITSRELINETSIKSSKVYQTYKLKGLKTKYWFELFNVCNQTDINYLSKIYNTFNGNAKAMLIIKSIVQYEYDNNLKLFFNSYNANVLDLPLSLSLENLISERFKRVKMIHPTAYKLLCRMGCYRYQDISKTSLTGLNCLLWENTDRTKAISTCLDAIEYLERSCLVESIKNEYEYWLHPSMKTEATKILKNNKNWEITNQKIAEFFSEKLETINSINDALLVLEACHHYIEIKDFINAATVIIKDRDSPYENIESLGVALYRLGLFTLAIEVVEKLLEEKLTDYLKCRLCNIMGEFYQDNGNNSKAINYYEKSKYIAMSNINEVYSGELSKDPRRSFKNLYIASFYNTGLSYLALWEIDKARQEFNQIKDSTPESFIPYINGARFLGDVYCSILLGNSLNNKTKREFYNLANSFPGNSLIDFSNPWALGFFGVIFGLVYIHFCEYLEAEKIFNKVLEKTKQMNYHQFQGNALSSLAILHRENNEEFDKAIEKHSKAIKLLEGIGCKVDLAEAYLQLGLTYKKIDRTEKSEENFDLAKDIFKEINAPKQVERIQLLTKDAN